MADEHPTPGDVYANEKFEFVYIVLRVERDNMEVVMLDSVRPDEIMIQYNWNCHNVKWDELVACVEG